MKKTDPLRKMSLPVSEIFSSLQGEGPFIGHPSVFLRLGGCIEPYCPWCDTPYALEEMEDMPMLEVLEKILSCPCRRVVITGGEPFLHWENGLSELHRRLSEKKCEIQYETSGKFVIPLLEDAVVVCSPKHIAGAWRFEKANVGAVHYFKFLACGSDWPEAVERFVTEHGIDRERIYIMPLGATRQEQIDGMEAVFSFCVERGYKMSPRLHILTYDRRRGV